jgi:hypothetical protein
MGWVVLCGFLPSACRVTVASVHNIRREERLRDDMSLSTDSHLRARWRIHIV